MQRVSVKNTAQIQVFYFLGFDTPYKYGIKLDRLLKEKQPPVRVAITSSKWTHVLNCFIPSKWCKFKWHPEFRLKESNLPMLTLSKHPFTVIINEVEQDGSYSRLYYNSHKQSFYRLFGSVNIS